MRGNNRCYHQMTWLDEGIRRSDESGGDGDDDGDGGDDGGVGDDGGDGGGGDGDDDGYRSDGGNDEETYDVGGSQRGGAITWDSEYYATQAVSYTHLTLPTIYSV